MSRNKLGAICQSLDLGKKKKKKTKLKNTWSSL